MTTPALTQSSSVALIRDDGVEPSLIEKRMHLVHRLLICALISLLVPATTVLKAEDVPISVISFVPLDIQPWGNLKLDEDFHLVGNNLKTLGHGKQTLGNVDFLVGERFIHLAGKRAPAYPESAVGIVVDRNVKRIHFLQAGGWGVAMSDGITIGEYVIHYDDESVDHSPIVYGQDIRDWWMFDNRSVNRSELAWTGLNHASRDFQGERYKLRLFKMTWVNQHIDKKVTKIDFVSFNNSICSPFLVAASAEPSGVADSNTPQIESRRTRESRPSPPASVLADSEDSQSIANLRDIGAFLQFNDQRQVVYVSLSGAGPRRGRPRGTEETVGWVANVPSVEFLDVAWSSITNSSLEVIGKMPNLRSLNLNLTQVSDEGFQHLKDRTTLEHLWLHHTRLSDAGLQYLAGLTNLKSLDLSNTSVTNAGLSSLEGLSNLVELDLRETTTSEDLVDGLRKVLPKARIKR